MFDEIFDLFYVATGVNRYDAEAFLPEWWQDVPETEEMADELGFALFGQLAGYLV